MTATVHTITLTHLAMSLVPVAIVLTIQYRWSLNYREGIYAVGRMLGQLLIIGYFLGYIFNANNAWIIVAVLTVMVLTSSWIALRTVEKQRKRLYGYVLISLLIGGATTLALVTQGVLDLHPWYQPRYMIPLAGMIFANAMNAISLAAERYHDETSRGADYQTARNAAFRTALIPITNSLFAVGLVSLPGMMTGQILSGVDPLIAARYQIMVMAMIFGSGGIASAVYLWILGKRRE
ncbi:MAG: ABC transporter permease [Gammaproteobacteria bacterium]|nr:MAG: ABC transporter permease [Gammaproteobacteria bacterium]